MFLRLDKVFSKERERVKGAKKKKRKRKPLYVYSTTSLISELDELSITIEMQNVSVLPVPKASPFEVHSLSLVEPFTVIEFPFAGCSPGLQLRGGIIFCGQVTEIFPFLSFRNHE